MFSAMIGMPDRAQLLGRDADVAAHDRAREDQQPGAWQVGDRPDGGRDVGLADERDRVDADPLAAQVVAVGLAHRAERDLGDLGPAADDDDPLAEDPCRAPGQVDGCGRPSRPFERRDERVLGDALDLELDLDERRRPVDAAGRSASVRIRPPASATVPAIAEIASGTVDDSRSGSRRPSRPPDGGASVAAWLSPGCRDRRRRGRRSLTDIRSGSTPAGRVVLLERQPRAANASRVAAASRGRQHQRAVGVLGHADDPGDVHAALARAPSRPGRASPADRRA